MQATLDREEALLDAALPRGHAEEDGVRARRSVRDQVPTPFPRAARVVPTADNAGRDSATVFLPRGNEEWARRFAFAYVVPASFVLGLTVG